MLLSLASPTAWKPSPVSSRISFSCAIVFWTTSLYSCSTLMLNTRWATQVRTCKYQTPTKRIKIIVKSSSKLMKNAGKLGGPCFTTSQSSQSMTNIYWRGLAKENSLKIWEINWLKNTVRSVRWLLKPSIPLSNWFQWIDHWPMMR